MPSPPTLTNTVPPPNGTVPRDSHGKITVKGTVDQAGQVTAGTLQPTDMSYSPKDPDPPASMLVTTAGGTWTFIYSNVDLTEYDMLTKAKNPNGDGSSDITFKVEALEKEKKK